MNVILTERVCGKTTLKNDKYRDFDLFTKVNPNDDTLVRDIIETYAKYSNDTKTLLFNVFEYLRYKLYEIPELKVIGCYLPALEEESLRFRENKFIQRDIKKYGLVRERELYKLRQKYTQAVNYCLSVNLPITYLKASEFLQDVL